MFSIHTSSPANMVMNPSAIWPESMTIAASLERQSQGINLKYRKYPIYKSWKETKTNYKIWKLFPLPKPTPPKTQQTNKKETERFYNKYGCLYWKWNSAISRFTFEIQSSYNFSLIITYTSEKKIHYRSHVYKLQHCEQTTDVNIFIDDFFVYVPLLPRLKKKKHNSSSFEM